VVGSGRFKVSRFRSKPQIQKPLAYVFLIANGGHPQTADDLPGLNPSSGAGGL